MEQIGQPNVRPSGVLQAQVNSPQLLTSLKAMVGQTLSLQVIQRDEGVLRVSVGGQVIQAKTHLDLTPGQVLSARVTDYQGQIRLLVSMETSSKHDDKAIYRQLLPNSTPVNQVLTTLMQPQMLAQLPPSIQASFTQLLNQLLKVDNRLTADRLKQALEQSGVFFENSLVKKKPNLSHDLKGDLFKLQQQMLEQQSARSTPSLAQAIGMVGQAINQISLVQYNQLSNPDFFSSSIPVVLGQAVEALRIELRHKANQEDEVWEVMFSLQLSKHNLTCLLSYELHAFKCKFYSASDDYLAVIKQQQAILEQNFEDSGLRLMSVEWLAFEPSFSAQAKQVGLIDVKV